VQKFATDLYEFIYVETTSYMTIWNA